MCDLTLLSLSFCRPTDTGTGTPVIGGITICKRSVRVQDGNTPIGNAAGARRRYAGRRMDISTPLEESSEETEITKHESSGPTSTKKPR